MADPKIDIYDIAARLWETADELRANSHLKAAEYAIPVLGLIFLKFADSRFTTREAELAGKGTGRREIGKADYQAVGVLYLPEQSRFSNLLHLKEGDNLGKAINDAMAAIEEENRRTAMEAELGGRLPCRPHPHEEGPVVKSAAGPRTPKGRGPWSRPEDPPRGTRQRVPRPVAIAHLPAPGGVAAALLPAGGARQASRRINSP